jgi:5-methylcytosine-specific restriction endonuclease McrA
LAQTKAGALKSSAKRIGISIDEYLERIDAGLKYCWSCRDFHPPTAFWVDRSRYDGLSARCKFSVSGEVVPLTRHERAKKAFRNRKTAFIPPLKGKKMSDEGRTKISIAKAGRPGSHNRTHTIEARVKMSVSQRALERTGERNPMYKDGLVAQRRGERFSTLYARWRRDIFRRDRFTCQKCGDDRGGNLNAHHVKAFATFPELRYNVDNGITLCVRCHRNEHARG